MLVLPETPITQLATHLSYTERYVSVLLPEKDERFRQLVRKYGYSWINRTWMREMDARSGFSYDRAAEIGRALLAGGFPVDFPDQGTLNRALAGDFAPENTRWLTVSKGKYPGWLLLRWRWWDNCYDLCQQLRGARYDKPGVALPAELYEEALDFADIHGFLITAEAQAAADSAHAARKAALIVSIPKAAPAAKPAEPDHYEVADALRDEPL